MGSEWKPVCLGDLVMYQKGFAFKSKDYKTTGHPVVRVSNFTHRSIDTVDLKYLSKSQAPQFIDYALRAKDVVIATVGSWPTNPASVVGKAIQVPSIVDGALLNQNAVRLRAKQQLDQIFLFHLLKTDDYQNYIVSTAQGSANQASITLKAIFDYKVMLPSLPEQKAIAHILGSLDDKIELNRQLNATLEAMAQVLFQSWFVDFDPVIDNALAAGNPIPEPLEARAAARQARAGAFNPLPQAIQQLFPSRFVLSEELGWVPEGWKTSKLKDCTSKIGSGSTPRGGNSVYVDEGIRLVRSQNIYDSSFRWSGIVCITDEAAEKLNGVALTEQDILINITGDSILRTCLVDPSVLPARVNQHVAIVRPKNNFSKYYLHQYIVRPEYKTYLLGFDAGGSRKAITKGHLEQAEILLPEDDVLRGYSSVVESFFDRKNDNNFQMRSLENLRDTLLPKLLSGQLRAPAAEQLISEVI